MAPQAQNNVLKFQNHSASLSNKSKKQRMQFLTRLLLADADAATDCEVLESILVMAPAPISPNTLAVRLLERFGSFNDVIHAEIPRLQEVNGVDDEVLKTFALLRQIVSRMLKSAVMKKPLIPSWSALLDYLKVTHGHNKIEQFRVLFMDHRLHLIADEVMHWGTINHTPVYPRDVIKRIIEHSAAAIILVHNHPTGSARPSKADIDVTKKIEEAAAVMKIRVHDHVIVTSEGFYSFRSFGLLKDYDFGDIEPKKDPDQYELFPFLD